MPLFRPPGLLTPKSLWSYNPIPYGCVLYLPLWALGGAIFKSIDPFGHTCTVTGALWNPYGRTFDGGDYIELTLTTALDLGDFSAYTIMSWFRTTDKTTSQCIIGLGSTSNDTPIIQLDVTGSNIRGYQRGGGSTNASVTKAISDNTWYSAAWIKRGATSFEFVVDRASEGTSSNEPGTTTLDTFNVGRLVRTSAGAPMLGDIGEVWAYSRALTLGEVQHNYEATKWRYR